MKRIILPIVLGMLFAVNAFGHEAFTQTRSEKKTITEEQLSSLLKSATVGTIDGSTITFKEATVRLVVVTGPEDDMLSYRIQGVRNPTLVLPSDAALTVIFVNVDGDMRHDIRFGHRMGEFGPDPDVKETVGTTRLTAKAEDGPYNAEEIDIAANEDGAYKYFCSVGSHAKGGMWGNILVGTKPAPDLTKPKPTKHVHSHDEKEEKDMPTMKPTGKKPGETSQMPGMKHDGMSGMDDGSGHGGMTMRSTVNIGDPMERESSGTAWAPDSSPVYAKMKMTDGGGMWMFMGTAFLRYTNVGSSRDVSIAGKGGRSRVDAPTMLMAMYSHPAGEKGQFGFRSMFSLDPFIERGYGYPLLYQSGEQFRGLPIHDRQHPHDLVSELAVTYSYKFDDKKSLYFYAGYPGEPALGPPMYLHRGSGMNNPDAPIGHHWQDATHITFSVVTAGFSFGKAKIEASAFNGTEPNENRYNFDRLRLNSFSGRFSLNPTKNLSMQISHGYLKDPEPLEPEIRVLRRTTASIIYNKAISKDRNLATSFVWGMNSTHGENSNSFLAEANYDLSKNAIFGRFEIVNKSGHDLVLPAPFDEHDTFNVSKFSIGYVRDVIKDKGIDVGLGGMFTANFNPAALTPVYGGTSHGGWQLFVRLRPSRM